jgi:hypothetical protein
MGGSRGLAARPSQTPAREHTAPCISAVGEVANYSAVWDVAATFRENSGPLIPRASSLWLTVAYTTCECDALLAFSIRPPSSSGISIGYATSRRRFGRAQRAE